MSFGSRSVEDFVRCLGEKEPTPGGGAAAAVAAALGNAAGAMSCAYSQRKKDVASGAAAVASRTQASLVEAWGREVAAADEDAKAYLAQSRATKIHQHPG